MSEALQLAGNGNGLNDWQVIRDQATILLKSSFLPQAIKTPEQAMAIILTGRELGIGTMAALNTINVIQGKPTISPQLMLALINRSGQLEDIKIETGEMGATCAIKRRGRTTYTARFGPKEAAAMGLGAKDNYRKQAATMYKWRAVADAARATFPDAILGLYTPDEMGAEVTDDGEIIETELKAEPNQRQQQQGSPPPTPGAPTAKQARLPGKAGQIQSLAEFLGWDETTLRAGISSALDIVITSDSASTLASLNQQELAQVAQLLDEERKSRVKAQGGKA